MDALRQRFDYIVICRLKTGTVAPRVVGPFHSQEDAVAWAQSHRQGNASWEYTPDVMQRPPEEEYR